MTNKIATELAKTLQKYEGIETSYNSDKKRVEVRIEHLPLDKYLNVVEAITLMDINAQISMNRNDEITLSASFPESDYLAQLQIPIPTISDYIFTATMKTTQDNFTCALLKDKKEVDYDNKTLPNMSYIIDFLQHKISKTTPTTIVMNIDVKSSFVKLTDREKVYKKFLEIIGNYDDIGFEHCNNDNELYTDDYIKVSKDKSHAEAFLKLSSLL